MVKLLVADKYQIYHARAIAFIWNCVQYCAFCHTTAALFGMQPKEVELRAKYVVIDVHVA